jgi:hypothetical protein
VSVTSNSTAPTGRAAFGVIPGVKTPGSVLSPLRGKGRVYDGGIITLHDMFVFVSRLILPPLQGGPRLGVIPGVKTPGSVLSPLRGKGRVYDGGIITLHDVLVFVSRLILPPFQARPCFVGHSWG